MFRRLSQAGLRRITALACAFLFILAADNGFSSAASTLSPERGIDLSFLGKIVEPPLNRVVQFVDNDTVAVAIAVHNDGPPKLVRRGELGERSAFVLHTALLDANTGRILKETKWPTDFPRHSGLLSAMNSQLLVLLGNRVALSGGDLELLKQLQLPGNDSEVWVGRASPTGKNALFIEDIGRKPTTWVWVDLTQLRVLRVWKMVPPEPGGRGSPISDGYLTYIRCLPPGGVPPCTLIAQPLNDEPVRRIGGLNLRYGPPEFVDKNLVLVHGWSGDTSVVNLAKKKVIRSLGPGFIAPIFAPPASATNVLRFVIPAFNRDHELEYFDVFDGPTARLRVFRVRGLPPPGRLPWFGSFLWGVSLSPDGKLLAVVENFKSLLIFRLPPPQAH